MGFTKLDSGIVDSSLWSEPLATRVVWITMLAKCNHDGIVATSRSGLLRACNVSEEQFNIAIKTLESPDSDSRTPDNEGRRIQKIDGGWIVLNYLQYREFTYSDSPEAVRQRTHREKLKRDVTHCDMSQMSRLSRDISASVSSNINNLKSLEGGMGEKNKYIDYVFLKCEEYDRLKKELGQKFLDACIFRLDAYLSNNKKKRNEYQDHNKVIRTWVIDEVRKKMAPEPEKLKPPPPTPPTPEEMAEAEAAKKIFNEQIEKIVKHVSIPEGKKV